MKNLLLFIIGIVNLGSLLFTVNSKWVPVVMLSSFFCIYYSIWLEREKAKIQKQHTKELEDSVKYYCNEIFISNDALEKCIMDYNVLLTDYDYLKRNLKLAQQKVDMQVIMNESGLVSDAKFGKDRMFSAPLEKAKEEVQEAIDSGKIEEFADILICVFDAARKKGFNMKMLFRASMKKINILWNREWLPLNEKGITSHVKCDVVKETNGNAPSIINS